MPHSIVRRNKMSHSMHFSYEIHISSKQDTYVAKLIYYTHISGESGSWEDRKRRIVDFSATWLKCKMELYVDLIPLLSRLKHKHM